MEQALSQFLLSILKFTAPRRNLIIKIFKVLIGLVIASWLMAYAFATHNLDAVFLPMYEMGRLVGEVSIVLYVLTLVPGMITRLQFRPTLTQPIASILLPYRRYLGILMFLLAFVHMSFTTTMAAIIENGFDMNAWHLAQFQVMGMIAWWLLLPLWITSNDLSVRDLGKWWKIIHKLTYVALFFIFLHVALQRTSWMYLMAGVGILEVISWIVYWRRSKVAPQVTAPVLPKVSSTVTSVPVVSSSPPPPIS